MERERQVWDRDRLGAGLGGSTWARGADFPDQNWGSHVPGELGVNWN